MEEKLSQAYQALLGLNILPEDVVIYEQQQMGQAFSSWLSGYHKIGWYLLNNGTSVDKAPAENNQIVGIWISQNCVLSPHHSLDGLTYNEAKFFCATQRINNYPLRMSVHSRIIFPRLELINTRLVEAGFPPLQKHALYWSANSCQTSKGKIFKKIRDVDSWEAYSVDIDNGDKALCFAVLDLSFLQE